MTTAVPQDRALEDLKLQVADLKKKLEGQKTVLEHAESETLALDAANKELTEKLKAEETSYQKLQRQAKDKQAEAKARVEELSKEIQDLNDQIKSTGAKSKEPSSAVDASSNQQDLEELQMQLTETESELKTAEEELDALYVENEELRARIENVSARNEQLQKDVEAYKQSLADCEDTEDQATQDLAAKAKELESLKKAIAKQCNSFLNEDPQLDESKRLQMDEGGNWTNDDLRNVFDWLKRVNQFGRKIHLEYNLPF